MKKLLFMLLAMFLVAGCSKSEKETPPAETQLEVSKASVDFTEEAGKEIVNITTNNEWTAAFVNDRASEWCTINPKSGVAGLTAMEISVKENTTPDSRSASVNISSGGKTKTLQISQKQKNALTVTSNKFEVSYEGGQISIEAKHNVNLTYTIESAAQSWIKYVSTKALKTSNLVFDVLPNENKEKREGKIVITGGSASDVLSEEITVYQEGEKPAIVLTKNEISVSSDASTIDIDVKSNVDVQVQIPSGAGWITHSQTKAMSTNTYSFDIQANEEYDQRSATITFVNEQNGLSESVTVTQKQKDALTVTANKFDVPVDGGYITVEVKHNVQFSYSIESEAASWISKVETKALSTSKLEFEVAAYDGDESRTGKIIISAGNLGDTITVKQTAAATSIDHESIPHDEIWYKTNDKKVFDFNYAAQINPSLTRAFDRNIVSNEYKNGIGIIKFDGTVTVLNDYSLSSNSHNRITEVFLPNSIEHIGMFAINNKTMTTMHVPKNLKVIDTYGIMCENLEKFTGYNISEDGRCIIVDKTIIGFAPKGLKEYTTPEGAEIIDDFGFSFSNDLEIITISEGIKEIRYHSLSNNPNLKKIYFPKSLQDMGLYIGMRSDNLEGFYGNEKFHTSDNRCLITYYSSSTRPQDWWGYYVVKFAGGGVTDYTLPEGIVGVDNYAFSNCNDLKSITLVESLRHFGASAIENCPNLEALYGPYTTSDHRGIQFGTKLQRLIVTKGLPSNYHIPDDITEIGYSAFEEIQELENVTMGDQVTVLGGYAFMSCPNLKSVVLSGNLERIGDDEHTGYNPFLKCMALESIYFRSYSPPSYLDHQKSDYQNLTVYVPSVSEQLYKRDVGWIEFNKYMKPYNCENMPEPKHYISKDFSKHGEVTLLQQATVGKGINLVLMGDIYTDKMIAEGKYEADMRRAADALFTIEPYKSFRNMFNVYMVTAVSAVGKMFTGSTAFMCKLPPEGSNGLSGYDPLAMEFALKAVGEGNMDDAMAIVIVNDPYHAGICFMTESETQNNDWGAGFSLSYFTLGTSDADLAYLIQHEAGGHGFPKLSDEYQSLWQIDAMEKIKLQDQAKKGWHKNIDFTNNPQEVKWAKFISDPRYANEGISVYQGGGTYMNGVWRSTEQSIMNTSYALGFNAPSREAIYYRIHKLAYGADWEYNYETFVEWDAKNRKSSSSASKAAYAKPSAKLEHTPPVVRKMTWREIIEAGKNGKFIVGGDY